MEFNETDARNSIIKWVDAQITFNPYTISETKSLEFFRRWQQVFLPSQKYIELHLSCNPDSVSYSWVVYCCTARERYAQYAKYVFEFASMEGLWSDYLLINKKHIIIVRVDADSVNNIRVSFNG